MGWFNHQLGKQSCFLVFGLQKFKTFNFWFTWFFFACRKWYSDIPQKIRTWKPSFLGSMLNLGSVSGWNPGQIFTIFFSECDGWWYAEAIMFLNSCCLLVASQEIDFMKTSFLYKPGWFSTKPTIILIMGETNLSNIHPIPWVMSQAPCWCCESQEK